MPRFFIIMILSSNPDLAWCEINQTLIFLDVANDRYFRLADEQNRKMLENLAGCELNCWHQPVYLTPLSEWTPPSRSCTAINDGSFRLTEVARALWMQRRVERRLASQSLASVIGALRQISKGRAAPLPVSSGIAKSVIRGFEHARLLRTAAERCLARSIALSLCLASRGVRAHVVLGVRLAPFGAHCWAQSEDEVLNDSIEEVLRYKPILFI